MTSSCRNREVCFHHEAFFLLDLKDAGSQSYTKCFSYVFSKSLQHTVPALPCRHTLCEERKDIHVLPFLVKRQE